MRENNYCPMYLQWEKSYADLDWTFFIVALYNTADFDLQDIFAFGA